MQCIICKIYFWKVFHKYYNFIYTPICTKFLFLQKVGVTVTEDHCDSWVMCTTSAECKTIITVMLTVMSGMDPHMISGTRVGLIESSVVSPVD
jgi:hypothetical protein